MRVGLVGCVKSKRPGRCEAKNLYTSTLFQGRRAFVERSCDRWFILSAKHGRVDPDEVLDSYDECLADLGRAARRAWSAKVLQQLEKALGPLNDHEFEIHAGADYRGVGLGDGLVARRATVDVPTAGLTPGPQLRFYNTANQRQEATSG